MHRATLKKKIDELETNISTSTVGLEKTVYGIVKAVDGKHHGTIRCWQRDGRNRWREVHKKPDFEIPEKLEPFLLEKKRFKAVYGGRGSGKTEGICRIVIGEARDRRLSFGCFREFQNSIEDSVYSDLSQLIRKYDNDDFFTILDNKIKAPNCDFSFRGLSRNILSIKGMNKYSRFWYEEAQGLKQESIDTCTRTLRKKGSEHWFSFNPGSSEDPISKKFINPFIDDLERSETYQDDLYLVIKMNWRDNPWFYDCELPKDREDDYKKLPRAIYDHFWEGAFNDSVENAIISAEWFDACVDAHEKLGFAANGAKIVSHDPSDLGPDAKGLAYRQGSVIWDVLERENGDANEGMDWAIEYANSVQADYFSWDCDGLGVTLRRQVDKGFSGKRVDVTMFKGSESPYQPEAIFNPAPNGVILQSRKNKDTFRNKRSQCYARLAERVYNTYRAVTFGDYVDPDDLISFSSTITNLPKLRAEVCRLPLKPNNNNGYFQIMTKQEMKNIGIPSPNMADSVMMTMADYYVARQTPKTHTPPQKKIYRR